MPSLKLLNRSSGFTLLELLVVMGVISVLMGVSLGYLGKTDPGMIAKSIIGGELRAAKMTARAEGVPTEVWVRRGPEAEPASVQARLLEPVVAFHFEPGTPVLDDRLRPEIHGVDVVAGRFGHCRQPIEDDRQAVVHWPVSPDVVDVGDGFILRLDLFLERRDSCVVIEMAPLLEVRLNQDLQPDVRLTLDDSGGTTKRISVASDLALPLRRWTTLEVGADGDSLWIAVDGRDFARKEAVGRPKQEEDMVLDISPVGLPVPGKLDEFRFLVFRFSSMQLLPIELQPTEDFRFTFDKRGEPVDAPEIAYEDLEGGE